MVFFILLRSRCSYVVMINETEALQRLNSINLNRSTVRWPGQNGMVTRQAPNDEVRRFVWIREAHALVRLLNSVTLCTIRITATSIHIQFKFLVTFILEFSTSA